MQHSRCLRAGSVALLVEQVAGLAVDDLRLIEPLDRLFCIHGDLNIIDKSRVAPVFIDFFSFSITSKELHDAGILNRPNARYINSIIPSRYLYEPWIYLTVIEVTVVIIFHPSDAIFPRMNI